MKYVIAITAALMLLMASPAMAQTKTEHGGTGTIQAGTNDSFLVGVAAGGGYGEDVPSGNCDGSSALRFDDTQADGARLSCFAPGGSSEWTQAASILHPNTSATDEIAIGGTTEAGADIFLGADGTAVFNEQGGAVDFRIEGDTITNMVMVDGSSDSLGLGVAGATANGTRLTVNFATKAPAVAADGAAANLQSSLSEAGSGVHTNMVGYDFPLLALNTGPAGTSTNAATVRIQGAPTGATNNYALWIDAGDVRLDGKLIADVNTDAFLLVADGTNFNSVALSGDGAIDNAGVFTQAFLVVNEDLTFAFDGADTTATLANSPTGSGNDHDVDIFYAGYRLKQVTATPADDEFTIAGAVVTLGLAPVSGEAEEITATYMF